MEAEASYEAGGAFPAGIASVAGQSLPIGLGPGSEVDMMRNSPGLLNPAVQAAGEAGAMQPLQALQVMHVWQQYSNLMGYLNAQGAQGMAAAGEPFAGQDVAPPGSGNGGNVQDMLVERW